MIHHFSNFHKPEFRVIGKPRILKQEINKQALDATY